MGEEIDDLIIGMGQGSRHRGRKKGRKQIRKTVRRTTIEFTEEMGNIINRYHYDSRKKYVWEAVYEGLKCLALREGYDHN